MTGIDAHRRLPNGRTLNEVMEFDHVIRVAEDGTVSDAPSNVYAPDVTWQNGTPDVQGGGWSLMNGYSGQQGYSGPVMDAAEFIGGRMADDILSAPGLYVAVVVYDLDNATEQETPAAGWAVAYKSEGE